MQGGRLERGSVSQTKKAYHNKHKLTLGMLRRCFRWATVNRLIVFRWWSLLVLAAL